MGEIEWIKKNNRTCCFLGHRKIVYTKELEALIYKTVKNLIEHENVTNFLFGSKSNFDDLCHKIITDMMSQYPNISRIYARAEFPYINKEYEEYLLKSYEETYFPQKAINAGKAVYIKRNIEIIDKSDICIIYYNKDYMPPLRKASKRNLLEYQPKSGTKTAYEYALKKEKIIINVAPTNT